MQQTTNAKPEIDWVNTIFLTSTPVIAAILSFIYFKTHGFEWAQIALAIVFYFATGIAITAGYHRLLAHRRAPRRQVAVRGRQMHERI